MAETTPPQTAAKLPAASELSTALKAKANDWVARFHGQQNHNPHLRVAQLIKPLVDSLALKDTVVTPELVSKINALPKDSPVINPDWKPEPTQESLLRPQASAATVGAKNAAQ